MPTYTTYNVWTCFAAFTKLQVSSFCCICCWLLRWESYLHCLEYETGFLTNLETKGVAVVFGGHVYDLPQDYLIRMLPVALPLWHCRLEGEVFKSTFSIGEIRENLISSSSQFIGWLVAFCLNSTNTLILNLNPVYKLSKHLNPPFMRSYFPLSNM